MKVARYHLAQMLVAVGVATIFVSSGCNGNAWTRERADAAVDGAMGQSHVQGPSGKSHDGEDSGERAAADGGRESSAPLSGTAAAVLEHCSIRTMGDAMTTSINVPGDLRGTQGLFEPINEACTSGGFDLARCAGQTAHITTVRADEVSPNEMDSRVWANVITFNDEVCCAFRSFVGTPGISSAACGPARTARTAMQRCGIGEHPTQPKQTVMEVDIPADLSNDKHWSDRARICQAGDYDLGKCAGTKATLVTVVENMAADADQNWKQAWVLTRGDDVCCIWETDGETPESLLAKKCPKN